jgi:NAD(P)-dependent dehydrogenase (short-subunit alcohol dehydrogenase family)
MSERPLDGKVAVVTGASRGIGRAVALELARLGADVVVTARTVVPRDDLPGTIGEVVAEIEAMGGQSVAIAADLTEPADVERLAAETLAAFGRVDILVNNAAVYADVSSFWEMTFEVWRDAFQLNVHAPWMLSKAFGVVMRSQGSGLIFNVSSRVARPLDGEVLPLPGAVGGLQSSYPASKAALNQMTSYVGNELRAVGVTMVAIDPGATSSENAVDATNRLWGVEAAREILPVMQPVEVAASAIGFIAASVDPSRWATKVVVARELVEEHRLHELDDGQGSAAAFIQ